MSTVTEQTVKERPILFSAPMVRAILENRKTQTRRVVTELHNGPKGDHKRHLPHPGTTRWVHNSSGKGLWRSERPSTTTGGTCGGGWIKCPYGETGDRLWVRESVRAADSLEFESYRADIGTDRWNPVINPDNCTWRPSIHMPRWACRITLEITDVRVQRVQDISPEDATAEGVETDPSKYTAKIDGKPMDVGFVSPQHAFCCLWNSINGKKFPWASNPWVWCITFKRIGAPK